MKAFLRRISHRETTEEKRTNEDVIYEERVTVKWKLCGLCLIYRDSTFNRKDKNELDEIGFKTKTK